jgi:hypothetical protein
MKKFVGLLACLFALAAVVFPAGAFAQVPPPTGGGTTGCYVNQNVYDGPKNGEVTEDQQVYSCGGATSVNIQLWFQSSDKTRHYVHNNDSSTCSREHGTYGKCVRDFRYAISNPSGSQAFTVCAEVTWYLYEGDPTASYKHCYSRKL